ncbi:MAG TPA: adenylate/guanylate cyclase domain-containing protein [Acidimicrobiia bacterium]|nr:adenylate/guanylate cyclase domain-containing protein [Acidimicrobiia bacterium]
MRRVVSALVVAVVVTAVAAVGLAAGSFGGFGRRATDALFPSAHTSSQVVVVGIDQRSENALGKQFPWPRAVEGQLADQLAAAGAKVVVWDVVFSGPSRNGPADDAALQAALRRLPANVFAEFGRLKPGPDPGLEELPNPSAPVAAIASEGVVAQTNVFPDPADGVVRTLPLVVEDAHGTPIPALSLAAFQAYQGDTSPVTLQAGGVQAAGRFIPTESTHELRLNWADGLRGQPDHASYVSAVDVLDGHVSPSRLAGKVVFVGDTDPLSGDHQLVPINKSPGMSGVFIHANALNTMLTASYLSPVSHLDTTLWVALLVLAVALAVMTLPVWASSLVALVEVAGYLAFAIVRFDGGHLENLFYPFAALVVGFVAALGIRYVTETRQRRRVSALFAQYVPEAVARQLEDSGRVEAAVEGERLDVSMFFCDMRGFTSLSATLEPSQVRGMLNLFYELSTDIILSHGGTVLKFVGDEVFAVFGAPLPVPHHPQVALDCAMEIQARAPELTAQLADLHIPAVRFGIGMNSGEVVAAHVGGGRRRQYDIVGDAVNLASRLCGQAGKGEIVITEVMLGLLDTVPPHESMGAVALKGLDEPVPLVRVVVEQRSRAQPVVAG